jgi:hypothetical protein
MHSGGVARVDGINGERHDSTVTYSDTKLYLTTLAAAVARMWPDVLTSGGYWHHQRRLRPHAAVTDIRFQDPLLHALSQHTGVGLPSTSID